jgi:hypothetical protein
VLVDGAYVQITGVGAAPPGSNVSFVFASASPTQNVALNQELANTPLSSGPEPDAGSDVSDWAKVLAAVAPFVSPPGGPGMPPPVEPPLVWTGPLGTGAGFGADGLGVATGGVAGGAGAATGAASGAVGGEVGGAVAAGAAVEGGLISTIATALGGAVSTVGTALGGLESTIVAGLGSAAAGTAAGVAGGVLVVGALGSIILDRILHPGTFSEDDPSGVEEAQTGVGSAVRGIGHGSAQDDSTLEVPPLAPAAPMVEPDPPAHAITEPTDGDLTYPSGDPPQPGPVLDAPGDPGNVGVAISAAPGTPLDYKGVSDRLSHLDPGNSPNVFQVNTPGDMTNLFNDLSQGGTNITPPGYAVKGGIMVELPDGTWIGMRPTSLSGGPTIDIFPPKGSGAKNSKVHLP